MGGKRRYNPAAAAAALSVELVYLLDVVIIPPARPEGGWPALLDAALNEGLIWFTLWYFVLLGSEWLGRLGARQTTHLGQD